MNFGDKESILFDEKSSPSLNTIRLMHNNELYFCTHGSANKITGREARCLTVFRGRRARSQSQR